jgi:hypothetical protein
MHEDLENLRDAWSPENKEDRNETLARSLADQIVADHPEWYEDYGSLTLEQLVTTVEVFRSAGMENEQWKVEAYLLHKFAPQNIGGEYQAQLRISEDG